MSEVPLHTTRIVCACVDQLLDSEDVINLRLNLRTRWSRTPNLDRIVSKEKGAASRGAGGGEVED